jgi:hypothetical protein
MRLELNGGSLFEPPFETSRCTPRRDHARGGAGVPRPRLRRRRHARHRLGRRSLARQPVSLLPWEGRTPVLLPGPVARADAGRADGGAARFRTARRPAAPSRRRTRPLPARRGGRIGGASRGGRTTAAAARAHRRQARSLRARCPRAGGERHPRAAPAPCGRNDRHPRLPRRAQLDGALVPARRPAARPADRRCRRRLRRRRARQSAIDQSPIVHQSAIRHQQ